MIQFDLLIIFSLVWLLFLLLLKLTISISVNSMNITNISFILKVKELSVLNNFYRLKNNWIIVYISSYFIYYCLPFIESNVVSSSEPTKSVSPVCEKVNKLMDLNLSSNDDCYIKWADYIVKIISNSKEEDSIEKTLESSSNKEKLSQIFQTLIDYINSSYQFVYDFSASISVVEKEYLNILIYLCFAIILTVVIIGASYFLARQNPDVEKLSSYECGFEPYEDARHTFDVNFCVIAILFIIFDIEILFLIPWCISISKLDLLSFWSMIDFLLELGVGFFYVWYVKALDWN